MDRIKGLFSQKKVEEQEYAPLNDGPVGFEESGSSYLEGESLDEAQFSWMEYLIFGLIGVAMLWAWYVVTRLRPRQYGMLTFC